MSKTNSDRLPDFLIIGAMRSGTSWLANLLRSHPQIAMPGAELHFFDKHYDKGLEWYAKHFPHPQDCSPGNGLKLGEKTPRYLFDKIVPGRVKQCLPDSRFIAILRDPVERAVSQFNNHRQYHDFKGSFREFLTDRPTVFKRGLYARQIRRWFEFFPPSRFLFLLFEPATSSPQIVYPRLADFLNIDEDGFDPDQAEKTVNPSCKPAWHSIYRLGSRVNSFFWRKGWYRTSGVIVRCGRLFKRIVGTQDEEPPVRDATRETLRQRYQEEIKELEGILGRQLTQWKQDGSKRVE